jgi:lipoprotein-releasing system permease protein
LHLSKQFIVLNVALFISKRLQNSKKAGYTTTVISIATFSVALGIFVMVISYSILLGFKDTIIKKITSFSSHMQITKYDSNESYDDLPMPASKKNLFQNISEIKHIHAYALKTGLLKTDDELHGVILKGLENDFDTSLFQENLVEGKFIRWNDTAESLDILISKKTSAKLNLKVGDQVLLYFIQNPPRFRKVHVSGIYSTGMEELDDIFVIGDLKLIRKLNNWNDSIVGGIEIFIHDFKKINEIEKKIFDAMDYDMQLELVTDKYVQIFDWMRLLDKNVVIFLIIVLCVAGFNMMSSIVIMIMERTQMIGILRALGASNFMIGKIFLFNGIALLLKGLLVGNLLALLFCLAQYKLKFIPLDPENYYMSYVPIYWDIENIIILNAIIIFLIIIALLTPFLIIKRIPPSRAIRFS